MRLALSAIVLLLACPPAGASNGHLPEPLWKLSRGLTNVALGFPCELAVHTLGAVTEGPGSTAGAFVAGLATGAVTGAGWGIVRVGSGLVDVVTFPIVWPGNRPILSPEFAL